MKTKKIRNWRRQYWFGIAAFLLAGLVVIANVPLWAAPSPAPHNQTVPMPTATSKPSNLPTATPSKDDSDDNEDNSSSEPDPTATPEVESLPPVVGTDADVAVSVDDVGIMGEIVVGSLNVREGPSADYEIIGTVVSGETLALLARSADSAWWVLCCVGDEGRPGWASAQFIKPNIGRIAANNALPVVASLDELVAEPVSSSVTEDKALASEATESITAELLLEMTQSPPYVLQGEHIDLTFVVTNIGEEDAAALVLSDQLPEGLTFVSAEIDADGKIALKSGDDGAIIVTSEWPRLLAGESVTAVLTLEVAAGLPGGVVIDNLAAASAANAEGATAGISFGTVPILLPSF